MVVQVCGRGGYGGFGNAGMDWEETQPVLLNRRAEAAAVSPRRPIGMVVFAVVASSASYLLFGRLE